MYRLMLVDDESIVLEGMLKIIDFKALGFEVVCSCSNGLEAIKAYRKYKPDVVVTDICMEFMDGLEFIESVSDENNHTKFVIISGHQDFKFFKKALSLKVTDYILKPVTAREFRDLLTRISNEIKEKKDFLLEDNQNQLAEFLEVEKNMFFNKLMHIRLDEEEIQSKLNTFRIDFSDNLFQVAMYKINNLGNVAQLHNFKSSDDLLNLLYENIKKLTKDYINTVVFIDPQGCIVVIVNKNRQIEMTRILEYISQSCYKEFNVDNQGLTDCYVGFVVDEVTDLVKSFKSANRLNICGVLENSTGYYESEDILFRRANRSYDYIEPMNQWIRAIIFGDYEASKILNNIFAEFLQAGLLLTDLRVAATRMQDTLSKEIELLNKRINNRISFDQLSEYEIENELFHVTTELVDEIAKVPTGKDTYIPVKAIQYIEKNYHDNNLDLQQICDVLNVSVSYFSAVFKKYTDITFIKYLNQFRIDKAKYFLEYTKDSITDISERVGYIEPHYFGIVFKKYTQTSPKKFRMTKQ